VLQVAVVLVVMQVMVVMVGEILAEAGLQLQVVVAVEEVEVVLLTFLQHLVAVAVA
jgi:hypothetical protein